MIFERPTFTNRESQRLFFVGIGTLLVFIFLSFWLISQFTLYLKQAKTREAIFHRLNDLSMTVERVEAAYRGYLFTRDSLVLERYKLFSEEAQQKLQLLQDVVRDKPEFADLVDQIRSNLESRAREHERFLQESHVPKLQINFAHQLQDSHAEIRDLLRSFDEKQRTQLASIEKTSERILGTGFFIISVAAILSLGLIFLARKKWKEMLKQGSAQNSILNNIMDNLNDGMMIIDRDGKASYFNSALSQIVEVPLHNISLADLSKVFTCFHPVSRQIIEPQSLPLARALQGETVENFEISALVQGRQKEITVAVSSRPILDDQNRVVGAIGFYRDIQKYKILEKEWEQAQENARHLDRRQNEILMRMNTELKEPLTLIENLARQLLERSPRSEQKTFLKAISDHSRYLNHLLDAALDETRSAGDKLILKSEPVKVSHLVSSVMRMLIPLAQNLNVQVTLDSTLSEDLQIESDPFRLSEVLFHHLRSRIRASQNGTVSLKIQVLERFEESVRIYFEIDSQVQQVFVPKVNEVFDSNPHIEDLAKEMKLDIQIEFRQNNRKSVLSLTLDAKEIGKENVSDKSASANLVEQKRKKAIVVGSNSLCSILVRAYLLNLGFDCMIEADQTIAKQKLRQDLIDLAILDLDNPDLNLIEWSKSLKETETSASWQVSLIGLKSEMNAHLKENARSLGLYEVLQKPPDPADFSDTVQKAFQPVLNEGALAQLSGYQMNGEPLMKVLADDYFQSFSAHVQKIKMAFEDQSLRELQYQSHSLKSISLTLGLMEVASPCHKLETLSEIPDSIRSEIDQIEKSFEKAKPILEARIKREQRDLERKPSSSPFVSP